MVQFQLEVTIHVESDLKPFSGVDNDQDKSTTLIVASSFRISVSAASVNECSENNSNSRARWAVVFVPSVLTEAGFLHNLRNDSISSVARVKEPRSVELSKNLLSMIHPFLAENFHIKGICCLRGAAHNPADMLLLSLANIPPETVAGLIDATHCETIQVAPESTLQMLFMSDIFFAYNSNGKTGMSIAPASPRSFDIPSCPVCLHRLDPFRLGLPKPKSQHLCSKFCTSSMIDSTTTDIVACPLQRLLLPWPEPSHCVACKVVQAYWDDHCVDSSDLFCFECALQETLWLCLTCGFVGCGRYSNKHAAQHFHDSGHPYSLELATLRVWNYVDGEFSHRVDVLDCPSSPPLSRPWRRRVDQRSASVDETVGHVEKHPKKAIMIGEEYEALLQSALEDQAQHYEGEISRLHAEMTAQQVDQNTMTVEDTREVANLREEIELLRESIERTGHDLLEIQAQEAHHRNASQSLLREQQKAQQSLKEIKEESATERETGQVQIEELEQQIADLTANQRMMQQFSQNGELANAQIWDSRGQFACQLGSNPATDRYFVGPDISNAASFGAQALLA